MIRSSIRAMRSRKYVICMAHADPRLAAAGIERYIADEAGLLREQDVSMLCLFPFPTRRSNRLSRYLSSYWGLLVDGKLCGFYEVAGVVGIVAELRRMGRMPLEIQIHHLRNFNLELAERFFRSVPVAVKLFLHDFYTVCPQYNLMKNDAEYCGAEIPSPGKCADCASWTPLHHERIRAVLEPMGGRLTVVAPSRSTERIWKASFPDFQDHLAVVPHLKTEGERANPYAQKREDEPVRLAYVGAPVPHKGWTVFVKLAEELSRADLNYEFYHFGLPEARHERIRNVPVSFSDEGAGAMTAAIRRANIDVVLLWALWPETYSYTMQESLLANAMLITNPASGNIADVVGGQAHGRIFRDYAALREYALDAAQVRKDVDFHRGKASTLPDRLAVNDAILDMIDFDPPVVQIRGNGPVRNAAQVEALYRMKLLKLAIAARGSRSRGGERGHAVR